MARGNVPFLAFNRGLVSPKALARVDLDRTRLSAETFTNWLAKSQGAMRLRPGTVWNGSSYSDTGAEFIEFVASTDDVALLEMTKERMRIWLPSDTGNTWETPVQHGEFVPMARPKVDTTVTLADTGWSNTSTGGVAAASIESTDSIPDMTAETTSGVTVSDTGGAFAGNEAWMAADDDNATSWFHSAESEATWQVDFGAGNTKAIKRYSIRATADSLFLSRTPSAWQFQRSADGVTWTTEDTQGSETAWAVSEKRTFTIEDTGATAARFWRFNFSANSGGSASLTAAEFEFFAGGQSTQVRSLGSKMRFNATAIGSLARLEKRVIVSDTGTEHSLAIKIGRGPVTMRVGSSQRDDDYISETSLGTGWHNLAFTPQGDFWITLQSDAIVDRIVDSLTIGDSGTVEVTTDFDASNIEDIRYDQSADVVFVDCEGVVQHKIERRGTGRSWSFVEYRPDNGPFFTGASSSAKLWTSQRYGNTDLNSDIPFFNSSHVGALFRMFNEGQGGIWALGAKNAVTDAVKITGVGDTGTFSDSGDRQLRVHVTGTYTGTLEIQRSVDGEDLGFHVANVDFMGGAPTDTGTFSRTINDTDDNLEAWYRVKVINWTSGVALVRIVYRGGGVHGIARVTGYNSNTNVDVEVLSRFSDTGPTDSWQEGFWSDAQGFPGAVALHDGRLAHAGGSNLFLSEADNYESFDSTVEGDAGPIVRTLGSGPVDSIHFMVSLLRLILGTAGANLSVRSSSLDEPLTPSNNGVKSFSTQGAANLRAAKVDTKAVHVQRSGKRVFLIGFGTGADALGDYESTELTLFVPDLLNAGVVSLAVQRQPDTRIHCVLSDGTVGILTYEPQEEVVCWQTWETRSGDAVEKAMVLPGEDEDLVFYHVRRSINGVTKRYLERWATEADSEGDTGLSWLADCAKFYTDTGRATALTGFSHLNGEATIVWADDTGQSYPGKDLSYDTGGVQRTYTVAAGTVTVGEAVHHAVVGLPYSATWKSSKLAYAAQAGTALAQLKRTDKIAFVLYNTHCRGLRFGNDTGNLDPLPRIVDGSTVDSRKIFATFDKPAMPFPGLWDADSRIVLRATAPRPCTVLAAVPTVQTNEKV